MKLTLKMSGSIKEVEVNESGTSSFVFSKGKEYVRDLETVAKLTDILLDTLQLILAVFFIFLNLLLTFFYFYAKVL